MTENYITFSTTKEQKRCICDVLSDSSVLSQTRSIIKAEYFTDKEMADIWNRIITKWDAKEVVEPLTILKPSEFASYAEGMDYVTPLQATARAQALRTAHLRSEILRRSLELSQKVSGGIDESEMLHAIKAMETEVVEAFDNRSGVSDMSQAIESLAKQLEKEQKDKYSGRRNVVPTGFPDMDMCFYGGLRGGNLCVLAARPAVGKSSVALQIARSAAQAGFKVLYFSLEMMDDEIARKMMYAIGGLDARDVATLDIDWERFERVAAQLRMAPITIDYKTRNIDEIIAKITLAKQQGQCDLAVIDHIGLTTVSTKGASSYQAMNERTGKLKQLAMLADIPILALCQLNRASVAEKREPELQDLRDSGSIEQDADKVVMLDSGTDDHGERTLKIFIRKNRQGKSPFQYLEYIPNDTFSAFRQRGYEFYD